MELGVFEQVGEVVRTLVVDGDRIRFRAHRRGVKVWFDDPKPSRFHFEAQTLPNHLAAHDADPDGVSIEVGFHAEHGDDNRNKAVIDRLSAAESTWRKALGPNAAAGPFLGNEKWGRLSETWSEPDLDDPDLAFELAARLADYIDVVAPLIDGP